ncbi:MAG: LysM peptidoglycan-binding domain-containing protein [Scytolyngbya sp. HA4215-MV1]|nr:LysM peptidoglycan-binding domain-containing protein [Scytolyngbya sp. HA4215-MV1]
MCLLVPAIAKSFGCQIDTIARLNNLKTR